MPTKLLIICITANAVLGQILIKKALVSLGGRAALNIMPKFILDALTSPWIYTSLAVQGFGYFLWMMLISREKLGVATASVGAGFYILTPLCAWAIYGETLTNFQWFGVGLIAVGVTVLTSST